MGKAIESKTTITFSSLTLEQAVFQVRAYNRGVLQAVLPDFWDGVESRLEMPVRYGMQDGVSVCRLNTTSELSIDQEQFSVVEYFPAKSLLKFIRIANSFYDIVREILRTERIMRAGFRLIYSLDFDDPDSVAQAFLNLPYISVPVGLSLSKKAKSLIPTYNFGWSDEKKSIVYRLKGNASKLTVDLPVQLSFSGEYPEKIEKSYNQFIFDVDVFISEPILPDEFLPQEWLSQAYEAVKLDGKILFGE